MYSLPDIMHFHMSRDTRFPKMWYVRPVKAQTSLRIRAVWSEPLLAAWVFYDSEATDWTSFGVSKLKRRLHMLIWVYTCQNVTLLEITWHGSIIFSSCPLCISCLSWFSIKTKKMRKQLRMSNYGLRMRLAPSKRLKPSRKIFYWPFQGGTSFVNILCFFCLVFAMPLCASVCVCLVVTCWEGLTSWLSFVVSNCEFSLSHWYPGSGVVLDCIDSWSLHHYFVLK